MSHQFFFFLRFTILSTRVTSLLHSECSVWISSIYLVKSLWYRPFSFMVPPPPIIAPHLIHQSKIQQQWLMKQTKGYSTKASQFQPCCCLVAKSCLTFFWPHVGCSLPGSSAHGISQARTLEWVAISFSRGSLWPRDWTQVSCTAGRFFPVWLLWLKSWL